MTNSDKPQNPREFCFFEFADFINQIYSRYDAETIVWTLELLLEAGLPPEERTSDRNT